MHSVAFRFHPGDCAGRRSCADGRMSGSNSERIRAAWHDKQGRATLYSPPRAATPSGGTSSRDSPGRTCGKRPSAPAHAMLFVRDPRDTHQLAWTHVCPRVQVFEWWQCAAWCVVDTAVKRVKLPTSCSAAIPERPACFSTGLTCRTHRLLACSEPPPLGWRSDPRKPNGDRQPCMAAWPRQRHAAALRQVSLWIKSSISRCL